MNLIDPIIAEFEYEYISTRKMLERLPSESFSWKPHEKSMSLGRLAGHISEIFKWILPVINSKELNFATEKYEPFTPKSREDLIEALDKSFKKGISEMKGQSDENMLKLWALKAGDHVIFEMPRIGVLRGFVLKHFIHHRGQLSVYMRLLDIPVPSIYGPSADEQA